VIGRGGHYWLDALATHNGHLTGRAAGPSVAAIGNLRSLRAAQRALALYVPLERRLMTFVVLLNNAVAKWVVAQAEIGHKTDAHIEQARLVGCLDRLVEHFHSEVEHLVSRGWTA